jgi:Protein of unknown function (DUF3048) N-terminal domain/Protein of unknown function (DUF3048) C-terminal domain
LAVTVALVSACGGHHQVAAPPTTTTVPVPPPSTTTTTRPKSPARPATTAPLTGLPQPYKVQLAAPAVVVKIDNVDAARPQTGINQADVVYEELVEGGLTRLAAVFQSQYPSVVGPVRSGRLTDEGIIDDLNHPVFAYSGTNGIFLPILRSQPITDIDDENHPSQFYRTNYAASPHNLYANVNSLAGAALNPAPPAPLFSFLGAGKSFGGAGITPDISVHVGFPEASVTWDWNAQDHLWLRDQNGTIDVDRAGIQMSAANVIVQFVPYITSAMATGEGGPPAPIPEGLLVGSGVAWFFSNGHVVKGTWSRSSLTSVTTYKDASGAIVRLTRGRTWVELAPNGVVPTLLP